MKACTKTLGMRTHFHLYDGTAFQSSGEWKPTVDYICEGIRLQLALVAYQTKETSDKWPHLVLEVYSGKLSSKSFQHADLSRHIRLHYLMTTTFHCEYRFVYGNQLEIHQWCKHYNSFNTQPHPKSLNYGIACMEQTKLTKLVHIVWLILPHKK